MDAIISSLQSIRRPSFLSQQQGPQTSNVAQTAAVAASTNHDKTDDKKEVVSAPNAFAKLAFIADNNNHEHDDVDLPALSFTDFAEYDTQPYHQLFIRDRLRFRIESNKEQYAKHGIIPVSVPLQQEIKAIQDILIAGGTLSELRMSQKSQKLHVILKYSDIDARPDTKLIAQISDQDLTHIISKYNNLRRTTLIKQPCLLCGVYDLHFLQFLLSIIKRLNIDIVKKTLMQFLSNSLIYCLLQRQPSDHQIPPQDTTLDLLNYEALHTLLMFLTNECRVCFSCVQRHKLFAFDEHHGPQKQWFAQLLRMLSNHGLDLNKMVQNSALQHDTALMNVYNCKWLDLQQILMIFIPFQPFICDESNIDGAAAETVHVWCDFYEHLLCQHSQLIIAHENAVNKQVDTRESEKLQSECNAFAFEIQLTVFESFLNAAIDPRYLYRMIQYLYDKNTGMHTIFMVNDMLTMLLFCGHQQGYRYLFKLARLHHSHEYGNNGNIFKLFASFEMLLSGTNIISANLKDIGKIIAIRSLKLFHPKFGRTFHRNLNDDMLQQCKFEFMQCLKILCYDYGLYDFGTDLLHRQPNEKKYESYKYTKKLPASIVNQNKEQKTDVSADDDADEKDEMMEAAADSQNALYVDAISSGLKRQKKFFMECAYLEVEILQCLMELQLLDEAFIVDRFRNTYDFMEHETNINAKQCWHDLQQQVFLYNKNVFLLRRMKEKDLRFLFWNVIRVLVAVLYKEWLQQQTTAELDKDTKIKKRLDIEDECILPSNVLLTLQSFV